MSAFRRGPIRLLLATILVFVSLGFVAKVVGDQWDDIQSVEWNIHVGLLLVSIFVLTAGLGMAVVVWWYSTRFFTEGTSYSVIFRAWAIPNLAKYIPGSIWVYVGSVGMLSRSRMTVAQASAGMMLSLIFLYGTGILVGLPVSTILSIRYWGWVIVIGFMVLVALHMLYPQISLDLMARAGLLSHDMRLKSARERQVLSAKTLLSSVMHWLLTGTAFFLFCASVTSIRIETLPYLVATFAAAQTIGFLVLVVPAGIGVREAVLTLLLSQIVPSPAAAAIAVGSRIWFITAEILCLFVAIALGQFKD